MGCSYLAEAQEGEHGEDRCGEGEHQEVLPDPVPLQTGVHQEGDQAERRRGLGGSGSQSVAFILILLIHPH